MTTARNEILSVNTINGPVVGFIDTNRLSIRSTKDAPAGDRIPLRKWLGVPYAKAGRWERPTDPEPWTEPRECFEFGPAFPQMASPFDEIYKGKKGWLTREFLGQSEDAFTVNIFSPPGQLQGLSVIVWLYGGNLNSGSGNFPVYDPTEFVRQQSAAGNPCVVVTGNFRVGVFGWLSTQDLVEVNGHAGNFGLYDSIKIFEWTRDNISAFGGDASNVTAVGESSGAFLISVLLNSGRKLFNKVILESGNHDLLAQRSQPFYPPYEGLLGQLGLGHLKDAQERVDGLRALPWEKVLDVGGKLFFSGIWGITSDPNEPGWDKPIWDKIDKGQYDPWIESAILTIQKDEGTFFSNRGQFWNEEMIILSLKSRDMYSPEAFDEFRRLYTLKAPRPDKSDLPDLDCTKYLHDQALLTPLHHFATTLTQKANPKSGKTLSVFVCQFNCIPKTLLQDYEFLGVIHTGEIPYVFNTASLWSYDEQSVDAKTAGVVGSLWANFAKTGNPGWPAYTAQQGQAVSIDDGGKVSPFKLDEIRKDYREFWNRLIRDRTTRV